MGERARGKNQKEIKEGRKGGCGESAQKEEGRNREGKVEERKRPGEKEKTRKKNERMELKEIKMEEKK